MPPSGSTRSTMGTFAALAALLVVRAAAPALAQSDLELCQAATPQFPQACECVIDRAQAAGMTGPTLSRLLSNDMSGLPMEVFQSYGLIYVQCIQEAVVAGVPSEPMAPAPPVAPVTPLAGQADAPAPVARGGTPIILGQRYARAERGPVQLRFADEVAAGQWGFVVIERTEPGYSGFSGPGTHDGQGHALALDCRPVDAFAAPHLILAGIGPRSELTEMRIEVRRGNGSVIWTESRIAVPAEGAFLITGLRAGLAEAIRAGSVLSFDFADGPEIDFGLSGSNRALGPGACGAERFAPESFPVTGFWMPTTPWALASGPNAAGAQPVIRTGAGAANQVMPLEMACDRRLTLPGYAIATRLLAPGAPLRMELSLDVYWTETDRIALMLRRDGVIWATDPVSPADLARLRAAEVLYGALIYFDDDGGGVQEFTLPLDGFAAAEQILACPAPPPVAATARTDMTGLGLVWQPADFATAFDGMSASPAPVPGAALQTPVDVPPLHVTCAGDLFTWGGAWGGPSYTLRLTLDGDPSTSRQVAFFARRAQSFADPEWSEEWADRLARGQTLRMTLIANPAHDVLYPLDTLAEALAAVGC